MLLTSANSYSHTTVLTAIFQFCTRLANGPLNVFKNVMRMLKWYVLVNYFLLAACLAIELHSLQLYAQDMKALIATECWSKQAY